MIKRYDSRPLGTKTVAVYRDPDCSQWSQPAAPNTTASGSSSIGGFGGAVRRTQSSGPALSPASDSTSDSASDSLLSHEQQRQQQQQQQQQRSSSLSSSSSLVPGTSASGPAADDAASATVDTAATTSAHSQLQHQHDRRQQDQQQQQQRQDQHQHEEQDQHERSSGAVSPLTRGQRAVYSATSAGTGWQTMVLTEQATGTLPPMPPGPWPVATTDAITTALHRKSGSVAGVRVLDELRRVEFQVRSSAAEAFVASLPITIDGPFPTTVGLGDATGPVRVLLAPSPLSRRYTLKQVRVAILRRLAATAKQGTFRLVGANTALLAALEASVADLLDRHASAAQRALRMQRAVSVVANRMETTHVGPTGHDASEVEQNSGVGENTNVGSVVVEAAPSALALSLVRMPKLALSHNQLLHPRVCHENDVFALPLDEVPNIARFLPVFVQRFNASDASRRLRVTAHVSSSDPSTALFAGGTAALGLSTTVVREVLFSTAFHRLNLSPASARDLLVDQTLLDDLYQANRFSITRYPVANPVPLDRVSDERTRVAQRLAQLSGTSSSMHAAGAAASHAGGAGVGCDDGGDDGDACNADGIDGGASGTAAGSKEFLSSSKPSSQSSSGAVSRTDSGAADQRFWYLCGASFDADAVRSAKQLIERLSSDTKHARIACSDLARVFLEFVDVTQQGKLQNLLIRDQAFSCRPQPEQEESHANKNKGLGSKAGSTSSTRAGSTVTTPRHRSALNSTSSVSSEGGQDSAAVESEGEEGHGGADDELVPRPFDYNEHITALSKVTTDVRPGYLLLQSSNPSHLRTAHAFVSSYFLELAQQVVHMPASAALLRAVTKKFLPRCSGSVLVLDLERAMPDPVVDAERVTHPILHASEVMRRPHAHGGGFGSSSGSISSSSSLTPHRRLHAQGHGFIAGGSGGVVGGSMSASIGQAAEADAVAAHYDTASLQAADRMKTVLRLVGRRDNIKRAVELYNSLEVRLHPLEAKMFQALVKARPTLNGLSLQARLEEMGVVQIRDQLYTLVRTEHAHEDVQVFSRAISYIKNEVDGNLRAKVERSVTGLQYKFLEQSLLQVARECRVFVTKPSSEEKAAYRDKVPVIVEGLNRNINQFFDNVHDLLRNFFQVKLVIPTIDRSRVDRDEDFVFLQRKLFAYINKHNRSIVRREQHLVGYVPQQDRIGLPGPGNVWLLGGDKDTVSRLESQMRADFEKVSQLSPTSKTFAVPDNVPRTILEQQLKQMRQDFELSGVKMMEGRVMFAGTAGVDGKSGDGSGGGSGDGSGGTKPHVVVQSLLESQANECIKRLQGLHEMQQVEVTLGPSDFEKMVLELPNVVGSIGTEVEDDKRKQEEAANDLMAMACAPEIVRSVNDALKKCSSLRRGTKLAFRVDTGSSSSSSSSGGSGGPRLLLQCSVRDQEEARRVVLETVQLQLSATGLQFRIWLAKHQFEALRARELSDVVPACTRAGAAVQLVEEPLKTVLPAVNIRRSVKRVGQALTVQIREGDITNDLDVQVLVNPANPDLQNDGGVALALSKACGEDFDRECRQSVDEHGRLAYFDVRVTTAGLLRPASRGRVEYVLHVVPPSFNKRLVTQEVLKERLRDSYEAVLKKAIELRVRSIALPALGCGAYNCSPHLSASQLFAAVDEVDPEGTRFDVVRVTIIHKDTNTLGAFRSEFGAYYRGNPRYEALTIGVPQLQHREIRPDVTRQWMYSQQPTFAPTRAIVAPAASDGGSDDGAAMAEALRKVQQGSRNFNHDATLLVENAFYRFLQQYVPNIDPANGDEPFVFLGHTAAGGGAGGDNGDVSSTTPNYDAAPRPAPFAHLHEEHTRRLSFASKREAQQHVASLRASGSLSAEAAPVLMRLLEYKNRNAWGSTRFVNVRVDYSTSKVSVTEAHYYIVDFLHGWVYETLDSSSTPDFAWGASVTPNSSLDVTQVLHAGRPVAYTLHCYANTDDSDSDVPTPHSKQQQQQQQQQQESAQTSGRVAATATATAAVGAVDADDAGADDSNKALVPLPLEYRRQLVGAGYVMPRLASYLDADVSSSHNTLYVCLLSGAHSAVMAGKQAVLDCIEKHVTSTDLQVSRTLNSESVGEACDSARVYHRRHVQSDGAVSLHLEGYRPFVEDARARIEELRTKQEPKAVLELPSTWNTLNGSVFERVGSDDEAEMQIVLGMLQPLQPRNLIAYRVQNRALFRRYAESLSRVCEKHGKAPPDSIDELVGDGFERRLLHGTRMVPPEQVCNSELGLIINFANKGGLWGSGLYFSSSPEFVLPYAHHTRMASLRGPEGDRPRIALLVCRVITGVYVDQEPDSTLRHPPQMPVDAHAYKRQREEQQQLRQRQQQRQQQRKRLASAGEDAAGKSDDDGDADAGQTSSTTSAVASVTEAHRNMVVDASNGDGDAGNDDGSNSGSDKASPPGNEDAKDATVADDATADDDDDDGDSSAVELKSPPPVRKLYDSVRGVLEGNELFVLYDNGMSYPEYLVMFDADSPTTQ